MKMKKITTLFIITIAIATMLTGCKKNPLSHSSESSVLSEHSGDYSDSGASYNESSYSESSYLESSSELNSDYSDSSVLSSDNTTS